MYVRGGGGGGGGGCLSLHEFNNYKLKRWLKDRKIPKTQICFFEII